MADNEQADGAAEAVEVAAPKGKLKLITPRWRCC